MVFILNRPASDGALLRLYFAYFETQKLGPTWVVLLLEGLSQLLHLVLVLLLRGHQVSVSLRHCMIAQVFRLIARPQLSGNNFSYSAF